MNDSINSFENPFGKGRLITVSRRMMKETEIKTDNYG